MNILGQFIRYSCTVSLYPVIQCIISSLKVKDHEICKYQTKITQVKINCEAEPKSASVCNHKLLSKRSPKGYCGKVQNWWLHQSQQVKAWSSTGPSHNHRLTVGMMFFLLKCYVKFTPDVIEIHCSQFNFQPISLFEYAAKHLGTHSDVVFFLLLHE